MRIPLPMLSVLIVFGSLSSLTFRTAAGPTALPNPVLTFIGSETYQMGGKDFVRYKFDVANKDDFPMELFKPAPSLPPCGSNRSASRTWVDFYSQDGVRLNGFCALESPSQLNKIWFSVEANSLPPSWVYIEMTDRQTNTKYKSNLADTTN